jgi:hypothetical protein
MSLFKIFHLYQFCSPLLGFFWFVSGFVDVDQVLDILFVVWVYVTESGAEAFH